MINQKTFPGQGQHVASVFQTHCPKCCVHGKSATIYPYITGQSWHRHEPNMPLMKYTNNQRFPEMGVLQKHQNTPCRQSILRIPHFRKTSTKLRGYQFKTLLEASASPSQTPAIEPSFQFRLLDPSNAKCSVESLQAFISIWID